MDSSIWVSTFFNVFDILFIFSNESLGPISLKLKEYNFFLCWLAGFKFSFAKFKILLFNKVFSSFDLLWISFIVSTSSSSLLYISELFSFSLPLKNDSWISKEETKSFDFFSRFFWIALISLSELFYELHFEDEM